MVNMSTAFRGGVLILVLVEIGLGVEKCFFVNGDPRGCLNPCFSGNRFGRWSLLVSFLQFLDSLNPCFSGNRFGSPSLKTKKVNFTSLNPCFSGNRFGSDLGKTYDVEVSLS